jgi:hypothetical protein
MRRVVEHDDRRFPQHRGVGDDRPVVRECPRLPLCLTRQRATLLGEVGCEIERPAFAVPVLGSSFGLEFDDAGDPASGGDTALDVGLGLPPVALDILDLDAALVLLVELVDQLLATGDARWEPGRTPELDGHRLLSRDLSAPARRERQNQEDRGDGQPTSSCHRISLLSVSYRPLTHR